MKAQDKTRREAVQEAVDHYSAATIPVHVDIDAQQTILSQPEAEAILRGADRIALGPCGCRKEAGRCSAPLDTCLNIGAAADEAIRDYEGFRAVSPDQALEALRRSHEAGLVHLAYRRHDAEISQFCSCCSCCCWCLNRLKAFAYRDAVVQSAYVAQQDADQCAGCGQCVARCPFGAWQAGNGSGPAFDVQQCFGCGLCVTSCPSQAIRLVARAGGVQRGR